jgi:antitoxin YefM
MKIVSFDQALANLKSLMDEVCRERTSIAVAREDGENVVVMSLRDFESIEETLYLLGSAKNAARLMESIEQLKEGKMQARELIRDEEQEGGEQTASQDGRGLVDR